MSNSNMTPQQAAAIASQAVRNNQGTNFNGAPSQAKEKGDAIVNNAKK